MVKLGDIATVHRDGVEFTPYYYPASCLVPGYGHPRRHWSAVTVYNGPCVLVTASSEIYFTIGAVWHRAWIVNGPCAYRPNIWRICLKPGTNYSLEDIKDTLDDALASCYKLAESADDDEDPAQTLLDFEIDPKPIYGEPLTYGRYLVAHENDPYIDLEIPSKLDTTTTHDETGLTKIRFKFNNARVTIHRGFVRIKFTPYDYIIFDDKTLTVWDRTDYENRGTGILFEYGIGLINDTAMNRAKLLLKWASE